MGDEYRDTCKDEEEEGSYQVFNVGEGSIGDHLSLRAASECVQSGGSTEDDPVGPCHGHSVLRLFLKSLSLDLIKWHVIVRQFT